MRLLMLLRNCKVICPEDFLVSEELKLQPLLGVNTDLELQIVSVK